MTRFNGPKTQLVDVQFTSRAEAHVAMDKLDEIPGITVDIIRARIQRHDVAYELLIHGPAAEVRRAVAECAEWTTEVLHALAG